MNYNFSKSNLENAKKFFDENGFVAFSDIISKDELNLIRDGIDKAIEEKKLVYGKNEMLANQDIIFTNPFLEKYVKNPTICEIASRLINSPIELQHSKFNAKPTRSSEQGEVKWHQDYPFYPHSNFDLIACVIHLDDEDENSGAMKFIPGSHKLGVLSHCKNNKFVYECTELKDNPQKNSVLLTCKAGLVEFHHGLTLHSSAPKNKDGYRRLIIFQYRAQDSIQLSGVIWKCTGYQVMENKCKNTIRFMDGTRVEKRGNEGRLIDMQGKLKPD